MAVRDPLQSAVPWRELGVTATKVVHPGEPGQAVGCKLTDVIGLSGCNGWLFFAVISSLAFSERKHPRLPSVRWL